MTFSVSKGGNYIMLDKCRDNIDLIIRDYIDGAFPVEFSASYKGPKNVTFGKNREMRELVQKRRKESVISEEVLKEILNEIPTASASDEFYMDLISRYINLNVPGRNGNISTEQIDFRDLYLEQVNCIVSNGFGYDVAFKYVVKGKMPITSVVIVNPKQYIKTREKSL